MVEISNPKSKSYLPDPDFVRYIAEELRMIETRQTKENAGEELSSEEKKIERNLDKRKSTWMNKVFQMTADLIFFLECIAEKEELREEFSGEYEDLFGFGVYDYTLPPDATAIFENTWNRLISSILQIYNPGNESDDRTRTATYIAQVAVYEKMRSVGAESLQYTDEDIAGRMIDDVRYSMAWVKFFCGPGKLKSHFRRRIDSHNPVLMGAKSS